MSPHWLLAAIAVPLVGVAVVGGALLTGRRSGGSLWAVLAGVVGLAAAALLPIGSEVTYPAVLLETTLRLDEVGRVLLAATALVWAAAAFLGREWFREHGEFTPVLLVVMATNVAAILAADVATFIVAVTVMTFGAYPLVVAEGGAEARRAGRVYLTAAVVAEVALLSGAFVLVGAADGATGFDELARLGASGPTAAAVGLAFLGLGVKAGLMPVHGWLPLAHPVAPVPVSAVLSGTMVKVGLLGWLRFTPEASGSLPSLAVVLTICGLASVFLSALLGAAQTDAKRVLAYSTISQIGLMATVVAQGLASTDPRTGMVVAGYGAHHAIVKAGLFLGIGVLARVQGRRRWWVLVGLGGLASSLVGVPPTGGWVAKYQLKEQADLLSSGAGFVAGHWLTLSGAATALLMLRFLAVVGAGSEGRRERAEVDPRRGRAIVAGTACVAYVSLGAVGAWLLAGPASAGAPGADAMAAWEGLWPALLGGGLAAAWSQLRQRTGTSPPKSAGAIEASKELWGRAKQRVGRTVRHLGHIPQAVGSSSWRMADGRRLAERAIEAVEEWATRWRTAGLLFFALAVAMLVAAWAT